MDTPRFGVIPGLLGVSSNDLSYTSFTYGSPDAQDETSVSTYPLQVNFQRQAGRLFHPSIPEPGFVKFGRYSVNPEMGELRYTRKLYPGCYAQFALIVGHNDLSLIFNAAYRRYSDLIFTFHPMLEHLAAIITYYLLLENDYLSLHCAAVNWNDCTVAIFALPDTGKTQSAYSLVTRYGARLVSEDIAVYDGRQLFGCPFTRSGAYFLTRREQQRRFWSNRGYRERLFDHLEPDRVCLSGPMPAPQTIFILKPGRESSMRRLSAEEAFDAVYTLNGCEFQRLARNQFLDVVTHLGWPNLGKSERDIWRLTKALVNNCRDNLYELTAPAPELFADLTQSVSHI